MKSAAEMLLGVSEAVEAAGEAEVEKLYAKIGQLLVERDL